MNTNEHRLTESGQPNHPAKSPHTPAASAVSAVAAASVVLAALEAAAAWGAVESLDRCASYVNAMPYCLRGLLPQVP